jgi:hypothetical protein
MLKFLTSSSSLVYRALVKALRGDPFLQREIKTWVTGSGDRKEVDLAAASDRTRPLHALAGEGQHRPGGHVLVAVPVHGPRGILADELLLL